ncbi:MAG: Uma2 family endonuclease [Acidobacteria bacterium]|nr:Uma2 family endonuclease [Acidobacteriota bacterium]
MPAVVESLPSQLPPEARRRLTRSDCQALEAAGLLERERYELIDGELIRRMGKSRLHSVTLLLLVEWLRGVFGPRNVEQEVPIDLNALLNPTNEPEPDAIVLRQRSETYQSANPLPEDILLVAEVAATTREYDLGAKAALYALAGITEYWVLDLRDMRIVVHRDPSNDRYASIVAYQAHEPVSPQASPQSGIQLQDLLKPR